MENLVLIFMDGGMAVISVVSAGLRWVFDLLPAGFIFVFGGGFLFGFLLDRQRRIRERNERIDEMTADHMDLISSGNMNSLFSLAPEVTAFDDNFIDDND